MNSTPITLFKLPTDTRVGHSWGSSQDKTRQLHSVQNSEHIEVPKPAKCPCCDEPAAVVEEEKSKGGKGGWVQRGMTNTCIYFIK